MEKKNFLNRLKTFRIDSIMPNLCIFNKKRLFIRYLSNFGILEQQIGERRRSFGIKYCDDFIDISPFFFCSITVMLFTAFFNPFVLKNPKSVMKFEIKIFFLTTFNSIKASLMISKI